MAKRFDVSNYSFDEESGKWYDRESGNFVRNKNTLRRLYEATGRANIGRQVRKTTPKVTRSSALWQKYGKFFPAQSKKSFSEAWAKPMTLRGGSNPNQNFSRVYYHGPDGIGIRDNANRKWGANINSSKSGSATILEGTKEWERHFMIVLHYLPIRAANFRVLVSKRAMKVFQNSFRYQQFYSRPTQRWKALSSATLQKRMKRETGSRILREYGDLYKSLKSKEKGNTTTVYTDIVPADPGHHKKYSICYAGYHNEGKGTYGRSWNGHKAKPYIKRQFMGHSSYLDPLKDGFMKKMMKIYLFDSVFLAKKG